MAPSYGYAQTVTPKKIYRAILDNSLIAELTRQRDLAQTDERRGALQKAIERVQKGKSS